MARSQVEILIESVANLHLQLSAALARESELRDANADLANRIFDIERGPFNPGSPAKVSSVIEGMDEWAKENSSPSNKQKD